jgi:hypothetical protein
LRKPNARIRIHRIKKLAPFERKPHQLPLERDELFCDKRSNHIISLSHLLASEAQTNH